MIRESLNVPQKDIEVIAADEPVTCLRHSQACLQSEFRVTHTCSLQLHAECPYFRPNVTSVSAPYNQSTLNVIQADYSVYQN